MDIVLEPTWLDDSQKTPLTTIWIKVDLSPVQSMLEKYNLLMQAVVKAKIPNQDTGLIETREYPYSFIEKTAGNETFSFNAVVYGEVTEKSQIEVSIIGYYIRKS